MKRVLACVAVLLASAYARADDEAAATNLFNAGRDAMKAGDYATACPKLQESVRLKATVGALAKLAACEEHEQRVASAYARWQQALNLAHATNDPRASDVEVELGRLDHLVPKLVIVAEGVSAPDLVVHVDALDFRVAGLGVPLPVEPGKHAISATAAKKKDWTITIETSADGATTTVKVPPLDDAPETNPPPVITTPTVAPPPKAPETSDATGMHPLRVAAIVTGAAGVAGLVVGGVFGGLAIGSKADASCQGTTCATPESASTLELAKSRADLATIFVVSGSVLVASGVVMWLVAPAPKRSNAAWLQPAWMGASVSGTW